MSRANQIIELLDSLRADTDGFTLIAQGDDVHIFTHGEDVYGVIEYKYLSVKHETEVQQSKLEQLNQKIAEKEKTLKILDAAIEAKAKL